MTAALSAGCLICIESLAPRHVSGRVKKFTGDPQVLESSPAEAKDAADSSQTCGYDSWSISFQDRNVQLGDQMRAVRSSGD